MFDAMSSVLEVFSFRGNDYRTWSERGRKDTRTKRKWRKDNRIWTKPKLSPFPRNASNPYYWEKNKKNKAVREILKVKTAKVAKGSEKKGGKKQNGDRKFERFTPSFEKEVPVTTFSPRRWPKQRVAVESDSE